MRLKITTALLFFATFQVTAQVGIGTTTPNSSSALEIESSTKGILIPRMTEAQRLSITTPVQGLLVFQTNGTSGFYFYTGVAWTTFGGGDAWTLTGNTGINPATNFIGTTDTEAFVLRTNNTTAIHINEDGNIGIGTTTPTASLHLEGTGAVFRINDSDEAVNNVLISDANGNATWQDATPASGVADDDWRFISGSLNTDPIFRAASVTIGFQDAPRDITTMVNAGTANEYPAVILLDMQIDAPSAGAAISGTRLGIGDSVIEDAIAEFEFYQDIVPNVTNSFTMGASGFLWSDVFTVNGINATSDIREKEAIKPLKYGSKELQKIRTVSYNWKKEHYEATVLDEAYKDVNIGFLAQNLQKTIPEMVVSEAWTTVDPTTPKIREKTPLETLGVRYTEIIPVLVSAIQEDQKLLDKAKEQQKEMDQLFTQLKKKSHEK